MSPPRFSKDHFARLWRALGAQHEGAFIFEKLEAAHAEPHRAYHTAEHIADCLALFDEPDVRRLAQAPEEVETALWFHDAVYDTRARDNEEKSALMATEAMNASGIAPDRAARVAAMVRATRDHRASSSDEALVIDIDLSILGSDEERFQLFEEQIRREYAWVEERAFAAGRCAVLRKFLERRAIFNTPLLRDRFEAAARANLARAISFWELRLSELGGEHDRE